MWLTGFILVVLLLVVICVVILNLPGDMVIRNELTERRHSDKDTQPHAGTSAHMNGNQHKHRSHSVTDGDGKQYHSCGCRHESHTTPDNCLSFEQRPMHTKRLHGSDRDWRIPHRVKGKMDAANKRVTFTQGYVNIGDIPTYLAEKVISEREPYKPESNVGSSVTRKCLQWLNSLDSDDEVQGC